MKRGTPRHPKVFDLMQCLDLPVRSRAVVIGYLELLWHFTSEFAPQGDIGRYSDERIEGAMEWTGKRGRLIEALTNSRWCDKSDLYRLVVHDWHEHADDSVRKKLNRSGLPFLSVTEKVTEYCPQPSRTSAANVRLPLPKPEPKPEPEPRQTVRAPIPINGSPAAWAEKLYARHPKKRDLVLVEQSCVAIWEKTPELFAEIDRVHALWCVTEGWTEKNARFCPKLADWLNDRGWTSQPRDSPGQTNGGSTCTRFEMPEGITLA